MTLKALASAIAKLEGKKHQASIGDVREIISLISDVLYAEYWYTDDETFWKLISNGKRRRKSKKNALP